MAIDYENFYAYAQLPFTPDVLIVPSELKYFVKVRLDCLSPGRPEAVSDVPSWTAVPTPHGSADGRGLVSGSGGWTRKHTS